LFIQLYIAKVPVPIGSGFGSGSGENFPDPDPTKKGRIWIRIRNPGLWNIVSAYWRHLLSRGRDII